MKSSLDLLIIGAGPAGLSCAIEAGKTGLNYLVVDKGNVVDSIQHFQRDMYFFSTPELLEIGDLPFVVPTVRPTSLDCVNYYRRVADHFNISLRPFDRVVAVARADSHFEIDCASGHHVSATAVVVATGYYDCPNRLGIPGEDLPHVTHYYSDPLPFYRRNVIIIGGKNSAVEAALDLYRHGAHVSLVHRGKAPSEGVKYWILPDFENRVREGSVKAFFNCNVREFKPYTTIISDHSGTTSDIPTDSAFVLIGYRPDTSFLRMCGIDIDPGTLAPLHDPGTMETNVSGIFVAGGIAGGRLTNKIFIENGRGHGKLIVKKFCETYRRR